MLRFACHSTDVTLTKRLVVGIMDILNLLGIGRHSPTTVLGEQDGRSGEYHEPLPLRAGLVSRSVHPQLGKLNC